jgi:hypothetical protein
VIDQSFHQDSLRRVIKKSDYDKIPYLYLTTVRDLILKQAVESANDNFGGSNPLESFLLNNKNVYRFSKFNDELVLRQACKNLKLIYGYVAPNRDNIIRNLKVLLSEGVPYSVFRLDVKSFYESFNNDYIFNEIISLRSINPQTKSVLNALMSQYVKAGGSGLPRGLEFSAVMSEILMQPFDNKIKNHIEVFFYARYVDDILIITKPQTNSKTFVNFVIENLKLMGLSLNNKKRQITKCPENVAPLKPPITLPKDVIVGFEYLGYSFKVYEPNQVKTQNSLAKKQFREVKTDIASSKAKRYKTRIIKSFLDFTKNKDFKLLGMRIQFLTSNFSVPDKDSDKKKLAGIYHNYPQLTTYEGLSDMDSFLKNAIFSNHGRVFSLSSPHLTKHRKLLLLKHSFEHGHKNRYFLHYNDYEISQIQECWKYA